MSIEGARIGFRRFLTPWLIGFVISPLIASCDVPESEPPGAAGMADYYSLAAGMTLRRPAPGVLANDQDEGKGKAAKLVSQAKYGKVTLEENGSFVYQPEYKFAGRDLFYYQLVDGESVSEPIPVQLSFPNVIVVLVDDMGLGDIASLNKHSAIDTPNLDALAAAGMSFGQAHSAAAVCAPSRYSLLTGNHPYRGRLSSGVWSTLEPSTMIIPGQDTLGNIFDESGYRTGFVGKMHLGGAFWNLEGTDYTANPDEIDFTRSFDRGPRQFGFDYSFVLPAGLSGPPYAYFENDRLVRFDPATKQYKYFGSNDEAVSHFLNIESSWGKSYGSGLIGGLIGASGWAMDNYDSRNVGRVLTRKALQFLDLAIEDNRSLEFPKPFFLYLALPQLHHPYSPPKYFDVNFADDTSQASAGSAVAGVGDTPRLDMIWEIDLMIGAITDFLKSRDQLDNTMIVFSSDNGPITWENKKANVYPQGTDAGVPLRGAKGDMYEGGHRVPLLVRWGDGTAAKSIVSPGSHSQQLIGLHDFAATFYALLGMQRPLNQANDSKSFLPTLLGAQPETVPLREHLIIQGSPKSAAENKAYVDRAFYRRDASGELWKLTVVSSSTDPLAEIGWKEFYNLSADPGESTDLFADRAVEEWRAAMQSEYLRLMAQPKTIFQFE